MMKSLSGLLVMLLLGCMPVFAKMTSHPAEFSTWRTYVNKEYGFTLKYPVSVATSKKFSRAYLLGTGWSANNSTSINNSFQHSIWQAQLQNIRGQGNNGEVYYYQSYVRIGVSAFPNDVTTCQKKPNNMPLQTALITTLIHNKKFYVFAFTDAGMSQYNLGTSYRRVHNNKCYSVEYVETGSNSSNIPHYSVMTKRNRALAKKIINTFTFTTPRHSQLY